MTRSILTLNAGSSSLKFALFDTDAASPASARGAVETLGGAPHLIARDASGNVLIERRWSSGPQDKFASVLDALLDFAADHFGKGGLAAVGHRVVHGGATHVAPELVTSSLLDQLDTLVPLDPLHMPHNIAPIRAIDAARPGLVQVACFDTAFHASLPPVARRFGLPYALEAGGVRRYGFHGLSFEYIASVLSRQTARQTPQPARKRVIVAHLGAGASLCALADGISIATTTGFSALDGLVMATRCGSLDPGVLLYLGRQGYDFPDIEDMLYNRSGLLGVSGISGDVRELLASEDPRAAEALELFTYRVACEAGGMVSALGGLDTLVFTAGIGEHSAEIRAAICNRLGWLGARLDPAANSAHAASIGSPESAIDIQIIETDEEAVIAQHTRAVISAAAPPQTTVA